jgi:hypothetical protein
VAPRAKRESAWRACGGMPACAPQKHDRRPASGTMTRQCGKVPAWFAASTMAFSFWLA